jgi:glutathione S-transferase
MFFEQYKHEPAIAVARFWVAISDEGPPPSVDIEALRADGRAALKAMERHLADRQYLVGERFTIADLALYAYTHVAPEGGFNLEPFPSVRRWLERVEAEPGVAPMAPLG